MEGIRLFGSDAASGYNSFIVTWIMGYEFYLGNLPKIFSDQRDEEILIVGCGNGNEVGAFLTHNEDWNITGIDPSPAMLASAKERYGAYKNVTLIETVISALDNGVTYQGATLSLVLHFMEDNGEKLFMLKEINKRLSPGAPFVIFDIAGSKEEMERLIPIFLKMSPHHNTLEIVKARLTNLNYIPESRLAELLEEAGFSTPTRFFQSTFSTAWLTHKK